MMRDVSGVWDIPLEGFPLPEHSPYLGESPVPDGGPYCIVASVKRTAWDQQSVLLAMM